jgi:hypothetical protein
MSQLGDSKPFSGQCSVRLEPDALIPRYGSSRFEDGNQLDVGGW